MKKMEGDQRPHRTGSGSSSELFICFTSRASSSTNSSSMKISSKSILSPGRTDKFRDGSSTLPSSLSRRLRSNGSMKGGQSSPMFPSGSKKKGCAFESTEPSSPKVTCIGQVRVKTKKQGKKMRSRSKRRGEVSFRKNDNNPDVQKPQTCLPNRNQRWVHFSLSVCEALRAFGAEFNCFLPCRSSCSSSSAAEREKESGGSGGEKREPRSGETAASASSCGAVFARWLMVLQETEEVKRRDLVGEEVEEEEEEERVRVKQVDEVVIEKREEREDEIEEEEEEEEEDEQEEEEVSVCIPPRNALLLMRCRSEPFRMSAFATRFWESPVHKEDEEEEEENGEDEEDDDDDDDDDVEEVVPVRVERGHQQGEEQHYEEAEEKERAQGAMAAAAEEEDCTRKEMLEPTISSQELQNPEREEDEDESFEEKHENLAAQEAKEVEAEDEKEEEEGDRVSEEQGSPDKAVEEIAQQHQVSASNIKESATEEQEVKVEEVEEAPEEADEEKEELDLDESLVLEAIHSQVLELILSQRKDNEEKGVVAVEEKEQEEGEIKTHLHNQVKEEETIREMNIEEHANQGEQTHQDHHHQQQQPDQEKEKEKEKEQEKEEAETKAAAIATNEKVTVEEKSKTKEEKEAAEEEKENNTNINNNTTTTTSTTFTTAQVLQASRDKLKPTSKPIQSTATTTITTKAEKTERKKEDGSLPDCLLLMMCEPKLSMEVSKETWVCSTDFLRCRPAKGPEPKPKNKPKAKPKPKPPCSADDRRRLSTDCNPLQKPKPSTMGTVVEQKLVNSAAACEPFVLTRCKSEPMRSSAKLAPEACSWKSRKLPHFGVGAAGVGF